MSAHLPRNTLRYALADLFFQPAPALLCLAATAIAALDLWLVGGVATDLYRGREEAFERSVPTELEIRPAEAMDGGARFDRESLDALEANPLVRAAYPLIEDRVHVALGAGPFHPRLRVTRGRRFDDPSHGDRCLAAGRPLAAEDELVMPRSLFERMGGRIREGGFEPSRVRLEIARVVEGIEQRHEIELDLVGLLAGARREALEIALSLAERIDRWIAGQDLEGLPPRPYSGSRFALARVEIDGTLAHRFQRELAVLGLEILGTAQSNGSWGDRAFALVHRSGCAALAASDPDALELLQPIVRWVDPLLREPARLARGVVELEAGGQGDVFLASLAGALAPPGPPPLVLPPASLAELPPEAIGPDLVIDARFESEGAVCTVPLRLVGLAPPGAPAWIPSSLARQVDRWRRGELRWSAERARFVAPPTPERRWVRSAVFAQRFEQVEALAAALSRKGYRVEHRMAEYTALRRLGRGLVSATILLVLGCLLVAALAILATSAQRIFQRSAEMDLLAALGIPPGQIHALYALQALVLGLAGYALALAGHLAMAPLLRAHLASVLDLDLGSGRGSSPLLAALILAGCVAGPLAGTHLAARRVMGGGSRSGARRRAPAPAQRRSPVRAGDGRKDPRCAGGSCFPVTSPKLEGPAAVAGPANLHDTRSPCMKQATQAPPRVRANEPATDRKDRGEPVPPVTREAVDRLVDELAAEHAARVRTRTRRDPEVFFDLD